MICYRTRFQRNINNHIPIYRDLHILRTHIINSLLDDHDVHWGNLPVSRMDGARSRNPTQFWQSVHRLRGCQRERFEYLLVDNVRISEPHQVASVFKTHWQNTFKSHPLPLHEPSVTHINNITANTPNMRPHNAILSARLDPLHFLTTPVEEEDVSRLLRHTPRRAPGPSGITWPIAKNLPPEVIESLTGIFNACLASGYFPKLFKVSNIILIPKPGKNLHLPENYRPISLLDILAKTFERVINQSAVEDVPRE